MGNFQILLLFMCMKLIFIIGIHFYLISFVLAFSKFLKCLSLHTYNKTQFKISLSNFSLFFSSAMALLAHTLHCHNMVVSPLLDDHVHMCLCTFECVWSLCCEAVLLSFLICKNSSVFCLLTLYCCSIMVLLHCDWIYAKPNRQSWGKAGNMCIFYKYLEWAWANRDVLLPLCKIRAWTRHALLRVV